jgi:CelD/BcsL family acetyltransferase involved in cellulose biosynthesis
VTAVVPCKTALAAAPPASVHLQTLHGRLDVLAQLEPEWRDLCEQGEYDQPFHRPELIRSYVEAFAPDGELVVFTARAEERLLGLLPLMREDTFVAGIPARKLRTPGNVHTSRYDLVHVPEVSDIVVSAIWRALKAHSGWDMLELSGVPVVSILARVVHAARLDGFAAHAVRAATSPYISLSCGEGCFERTLERLDAKFRANLRRRMRKLQAKGTVRLVRHDTVSDCLRQFYELEHAGWKGEAGSAIVQDTPTFRYYETLAREAERFGYLSIYSLECEGKPVAMHYGLTHRGRYFILKTAYDHAVADCSPGQLLTLEVLRDISGRQCVELDFLGLSMNWKRDWSPRLRPHADWTVFRGSRGALLHLVHARARRAAGRTVRRWKAAMIRRTITSPTPRS